jgi:hypothetical protein
MTVIRLAGDRLLLHSPVTLDAELRRALDALGRVDVQERGGHALLSEGYAWLRSPRR